MSLGGRACSFCFCLQKTKKYFVGLDGLANLGERPHRCIASALFEFVANLDAGERNFCPNFVKPLISSVRRAHDRTSQIESLKLFPQTK
jgi:hypothetical protein